MGRSYFFFDLGPDAKGVRGELGVEGLVEVVDSDIIEIDKYGVGGFRFMLLTGRAMTGGDQNRLIGINPEGALGRGERSLVLGIMTWVRGKARGTSGGEGSFRRSASSGGARSALGSLGGCRGSVSASSASGGPSPWPDSSPEIDAVRFYIAF